MSDRSRMRVSPVPRPKPVYVPDQKKYQRDDLISWFGVGILAGLIFLVMALASGAFAQTANPTRTLIGVAPEQVRAHVAARCIRSGWSIEAAETNDFQITCSHAATANQSFWMTPGGPGAGRSPSWFVKYTYVELPGDPARLLVTAEAYMQAYTYTGQAGTRVPARSRDRQQLESILNDLAGLCTSPCH